MNTDFPPYDHFAPQVPVWCVTPHHRGCIHRFFDTSPFSPSGRNLAVFQMPFEDRQPRPGEKGWIRVIDLEAAENRVVAESCGWEPQTGANLNWGGNDHELFFNDVDPSDGCPFAWKLDPLTGDRQRMEGTVYHASPDGRHLISADLTAMCRTQPGYGVRVPESMVRRNIGPSRDDGFYLTDTASGQKRMLISLHDLFEQADQPVRIIDPGRQEIYGFHCKFNPQGDALMLSVRWYPVQPEPVVNMFQRDYESVRYAWFTVPLDGTHVHCAVGPEQWEKGGHHATWCPDGRHISMNLNIDRKGMRFVRVNADGSDLRPLLDQVLGSGHPTLHPDGRHLLTDAYAWEPMAYGNGTVPLRWLDLHTGKEEAIARVHTAQPCADQVLRVDPHPAWDRQWRRIAFNAVADGTRRVYVADMTALTQPSGTISESGEHAMRRNPDMRSARIARGLAFVACALTFAAARAEAPSAVCPGGRRLVIAHHMNAEPPHKAGGQAIPGSNTPTPPRIRPKSSWAEVGGRVRDASITQLDEGFAGRTPLEQAAWEIAVAKRAGVDAFAFYGGIPGGEGRVLDYMHAAKGTGFKITLCSGGAERGGDYGTSVASLRRMLEVDRELDVLLRVDGKLLMLTYGGVWGDTVEAMTAKRRDIETRVGTPMLILYHPQGGATDAERERLGKLLDGGFDGLSPFMVTASDEAEALSRFWADICRAHGKMYFAPINFQFHSPLHMTHAPVADANWRRAWNVAHESAAGVQLMTWNDWGETSALAPGANSNYGLYDLLREEAAAFKAGRLLEIVEDQAWALYYRYPSDAEPRLYHAPSPRKFRGPEHDHIWVLTSLTAPATIVCEGRGQRQALAGRSMVSFPLTPGPVRITIRRGWWRKVLTLSPPEPVTDRPWRPDHSLVAFASDARERAYRLADFPEQAPRFYSEYGDDDGDGLMNWFEGLFFGYMERPVTWVGPEDNFNGLPLARAQNEFLDPVMPPPHYPVGFVWSTQALPVESVTPASDTHGVPVWRFGYLAPDGNELHAPRRAHQWGRAGRRWSLEYPSAWHRLRDDGCLEMACGPEAVPVLRWESPVDGRVRVRAAFAYENAAGEALVAHAMAEVTDGWDWRQLIDKAGAARIEHALDVKRGDGLRFFCRDERTRRQSPVAVLDLSVELLESRMPIPPGDRCDPPVAVDLTRFEGELASAIWHGRYRWGEAGLRGEKDGLAIFNPRDQNTRHMAAFYDTVPNETYGPLCRWGDIEVKADIRFEYGDQPPGAWGGPAFALTTRIAPQRRAMYALRIEVPSRQADPAHPVATLRLGWMLRAYGEPPREEVFAEASLPLPADGEFCLTLAAHTVGNDTVRLTGVCTRPDGTERRVLTGDRTMSKDGTTPWGEVGFAASLHEFPDKPDNPRRVLLRSFEIGPTASTIPDHSWPGMAGKRVRSQPAIISKRRSRTT